MDSSVDLSVIATRTHGYSGADLAALCREAAMHAISCFASNSDPAVRIDDFKAALLLVPPSICRNYEIETSPIHWDAIGGLENEKKKLRQATEWPLLHPEAFERLGLSPAKGVLLYGPPGCCKTTLARCLATACQSHLFALSCAQVSDTFCFWMKFWAGLFHVFRRRRSDR